MKEIDCKGKLIVVDMYSCEDAVIDDKETVQKILSQACIEYGMDLTQIVCCEDEQNAEYSVMAVCHRGHVNLHVYRELGFVAADVFSCQAGSRPSELSRYLRQYFETDKAKITLIDRGDFGSELDMKPRRKSNIKLVRRTKSIGNKLKKIMLKPRPI